MGEVSRFRFDHFEILEIEPGPDGASHQTELTARLRCLPATRRNDAGRTHTRNSRCEHLFMNLVVLPLSRVPHRPFVPSPVMIAIHMLCVGLPIAWVLRKRAA